MPSRAAAVCLACLSIAGPGADGYLRSPAISSFGGTASPHGRFSSRAGRGRLQAAGAGAYGEMTVVELKEELKSRNLPVSGKKVELIDRLLSAGGVGESSARRGLGDSSNHAAAAADGADGAAPVATPGAFGDDEPWTTVETQIGKRLPFAIRHALSEQGVADLRPIQEDAFRPIVEGRDVVGQSLTGTGKTLAYCLPLAATLRPTKRKASPRVVVIVPTRELARQVGSQWKRLAPKSLHCEVVYGGVPLERHQSNLQKQPVQVLVATPGRMLDLIRNRALSLDTVRHVVLDEADVMLDLGFSHDVEEIMSRMPGRAHAGDRDDETLLFSATVPDWLTRLSATYLVDPVSLMVAPEGANGLEKLTHEAMAVVPAARADVLSDILSIRNPARTLVFCATKREVEAIAAASQAVLSRREVSALHGDIPQRTRNRILDGFRSGQEGQVLVATDVAARGLDISELDLVVQLGVPREKGKDGTVDGDLYTHRSGRTARAGREGHAILLFDPEGGERGLLPELETAAGVTLRQVPPPSPSQAQEAAATTALASVEQISPEVLEPFLEAAWEVPDNKLRQRLAQALALVAGYTAESAPKPRSLLTSRQTDLTVRAVLLPGATLPAAPPKKHAAGADVEHGGSVSDGGGDFEIIVDPNETSLTLETDLGTNGEEVPKHATRLNPSHVVAAVKAALPGTKLGRVSICKDGQSAVFDLPTARAVKLVEAPAVSGGLLGFSLPRTLPPMA